MKHGSQKFSGWSISQKNVEIILTFLLEWTREEFCDPCFVSQASSKGGESQWDKRSDYWYAILKFLDILWHRILVSIDLCCSIFILQKTFFSKKKYTRPGKNYRSHSDQLTLHAGSSSLSTVTVIFQADLTVCIRADLLMAQHVFNWIENVFLVLELWLFIEVRNSNIKIIEIKYHRERYGTEWVMIFYWTWFIWHDLFSLCLLYRDDETQITDHSDGLGNIENQKNFALDKLFNIRKIQFNCWHRRWLISISLKWTKPYISNLQIFECKIQVYMSQSLFVSEREIRSLENSQSVILFQSCQQNEFLGPNICPSQFETEEERDWLEYL